MQDETECEESTTCLDDSDDTSVDFAFVKSTKEPTQTGKRQSSRCQKLESAENQLLDKAIKCLDHAVTATSASTTSESADSSEWFGRYVAAELRALPPQIQRWAKLQIQQILLNASTSSQPDSNSQFTHATIDPPIVHTPAHNDVVQVLHHDLTYSSI